MSLVKVNRSSMCLRHILCVWSMRIHHAPYSKRKSHSMRKLQTTYECDSTGPGACAVLQTNVPCIMRMRQARNACATFDAYDVCMSQTLDGGAILHTHAPDFRCIYKTLSAYAPCFISIRFPLARFHAKAPHSIHMQHTMCACAMLNVHNPKYKLWKSRSKLKPSKD